MRRGQLHVDELLHRPELKGSNSRTVMIMAVAGGLSLLLAFAMSYGMAYAFALIH